MIGSPFDLVPWIKTKNRIYRMDSRPFWRIIMTDEQFTELLKVLHSIDSDLIVMIVILACIAGTFLVKKMGD